MWGTWWEWDPRITSELIQLFLYLGYMALRASFDDTQRADRASAILAIVGVVNVPIVKYSVVWWNSLHQAPTISKLGSRRSSCRWRGRSTRCCSALCSTSQPCCAISAQRNPPARAKRFLATRNRKDIMTLREFLAMGSYGGYIWSCSRRDACHADLQRVVGAPEPA